MKQIDPKFRIRSFAGFLLVIFLSIFGPKGIAQPLLVENFDYPIGTLLTSATAGWIAHSGAGTQAIDVTTGLNFSGYVGSEIGGAALLDNTGEDVNKTFAAQTTGVVYAAFVIQTQSTNSAGYFLHLSTNPLNTGFQYSRLWVNATGDGIGIGASTPLSYVTITAGTPTLVVIKYDLASKLSSLYRFSSFPSSEPASPDASFLETTSILSTGSIALRQYSSSQRVIVDGIRVATTWADAVTPSGVTTPTITVTPTILNGFNYTDGSGPSANQSFLAGGTDLTDNISIAAPANYEISLTSGSGYTSPIVLNHVAGVVDPTNIFVRLKAGLSAGTYNGETVNLTSTGATPATVTCNGSVTALTPQLTATPAILTGFSYAVDNGIPSASLPYELTGMNLTGFPGTIVVNGSTNYEVSNDDINFGASTTISYTAATLPDFSFVFVRLKAGLPEGAYNGELISNTGGGAPVINVTCSGSVIPPQPTALAALRPTHMDISALTSESAVKMTLSNYPTNLVKYRIYGTTQFNCWNEATDAYISSSTYSEGPSVPGTPMTSSTFWILFQRGNTATTDGSYRDRLDPYDGSTYQTATLPLASPITTPFSLSGNFTPTGVYDNTVKHVVLGYTGTTLVSAVSTTLSTGEFILVCPVGTTIDNIEVRAIDNTLIAAITGTWTLTANVGTIPAGGTPIVSTPVIAPSTGSFYAPFSATISCTTPGASVYYTTDGTDPNNTGNGTLYTIAIPVSSTTTLKAIAYASGFDPSTIASETYTFPVINDVANIALLRAGLADAATVYRLTGEAVLTFKTISRNAKYIQDATGAILIDDVTGKITTVYTVYDGITGITGTLTLYNGMLQFTPVLDPGVATSTGNTVVPEEVTLASLTTSHQAKLVKVLNTTITGTGLFVASTTYPLTDPSGTGVMRTQYSDLNYIGTTIPATPQDLVGVMLEYTGDFQLIPRGLADFTTSSGPIITATPNTLTGFIYGAGNGPSTSQMYSLEGTSLSGYPGVITATGSASFEVSSDNVTFAATATVPFSGSTLAPVNMHVRLKAGLASGSYNGEIITNNGGGILLPVSVTCSGTILAGEPTNHASGFTATSLGYSTITVSWSDNDGLQPADGFLILANTTGIFTAPVDGVAQTNDVIMADGSGIMNVAHGVQLFTWGGLTAGTPYYFEIYPYTNSGTLIDYKSTPAAPAANTTTLAYALPLAAWTFETTSTPVAPNTPPSILANFGTQLTASFNADGTNGSSVWTTATTNNELTAFTGSALNDPRTTAISGNAIALVYNSVAGTNGKSVVFKYSMTGYENPVLSFAVRGTAAGFTTHQWAWSTDNVTYTNFGINTANTSSTFLVKAMDLSSIDQLDQAANVYLRLTVSGATSTSGNSRIDNVVLNATAATPLFKTLNASVLLEGLYFAAGNMRKAQSDIGDQFPGTVADQVTIELHDGSNYSNVVHTISNVNLNQDGSLSAAVPAANNGNYYVTIVHRNSITTTTASPVSFTDNTISYAFDAPAKAFGNNLLQMGDGAYVIFGGDVNQDGYVDTGDVTQIDNDQFNFLSGYVLSDANGDGFVDTGDISIIDNNQFNFVGSVLP